MSERRCLYVDTETRSSTDIRKGSYRYSEDPDFEIQLTAWSWGDGPAQVTEGVPEEVEEYLLWSPDPVIAHNSGFDRVVLSEHLRRRGRLSEGEYLDPSRWVEDTLFRARVYGYPGSLKFLARALGAEDKDEAGTRLIKKFAVPPFADPADHPEDWEAYREYCRQDVDTLMDIDRRLPRMPEFECRVAAATERMNDRGIAVDVFAVRTLLDQYETVCERNMARMRVLSGLENPNSQQQQCRWLSGRLGREVTSVAKGPVEELLAGPVPDDVREFLRLKQYNGLATAKKLQAILDRVCRDGRVRGETQYMGATNTGRFSSRGIQLQNLSHDDQTVGHWYEQLVDVLLGGELSAEELRAMIRPLFVGPFVDADYGQIEARLMAWAAGEEEVLEHFREGRDLYTETARSMGPQFTRKEGKVAQLGLSYAAGPNGLRAFGGEAMVPDGEDPDQYLWGVVRAWRDSHPNTVRLWQTLMDDFVSGTGWFDAPEHGVRRLRLPSGRHLWFRDVRKGWDPEYDRPEYTALVPGGRPGQRRKITKNTLSNNLIQAAARDIMCEALVRADAAPLRPVMLIHDEMLVEGEGDLADAVRRCMETLPSWAEGLPLTADPVRMERWVKA